MKPCAHTSSDLASPCRLLQDSAVQWSPGCGRDPTHAELSYWCHKRSCIVVQPQLTEVAFLQLMELMHVAGYQRAKARGTFQQREILQIAAAGGELGDYLNTNLAHTRGDGKHVNIYINLNEGKSGGGDECGDAGETDIFHTDTPSEGASIRCFNYFLPVGKVAGLKVRYGRTVLLIEVPRGCGLEVEVELLKKIEHAHGANGRSISVCTEVNRHLGTAASPAEIAAAASQPSLPLQKYLGHWQPEKMFLGNPSKVGSGSGSVRRMALTQLAPPKPGKGMHRPRGSVIAARHEVETKSPEEQLQLARRQGQDNLLGGKKVAVAVPEADRARLLKRAWQDNLLGGKEVAAAVPEADRARLLKRIMSERGRTDTKNRKEDEPSKWSRANGQHNYVGFVMVRLEAEPDAKPDKVEARPVVKDGEKTGQLQINYKHLKLLFTPPHGPKLNQPIGTKDAAGKGKLRVTAAYQAY